ncbi:MAG: hypothetical protein Q7U75_13640, partial [Desulfobacterales bacterium]|nr:hypothetical protein [Desulfobacterales bacterium]
MTLIKKFGWHGSSVSIAAMLAVMMLLFTAGVASATVTAPVATAPVMATGLTETWTVTYTESGTADITTGAVTFPTGFVVPQGTITGATATGNAACTGVSASGSGQVVSFTMTACATVAAGTNNFVIPGVKNPTTAGATASGFKVTTSVDATGATGATVNIWNVAITKSPASVTADGASTVALTLTGSHVSTNSGTTGEITLSVDNGTIVGTSTGGVDGDFTGAAFAIATGA